MHACLGVSLCVCVRLTVLVLPFFFVFVYGVCCDSLDLAAVSYSLSS